MGGARGVEQGPPHRADDFVRALPRRAPRGRPGRLARRVRGVPAVPGRAAAAPRIRPRARAAAQDDLALAGAVRDGGRVLSAAATPALAPPGLAGGTLGCPDFRRRRGLRYAYYAGAMYKGIASRALVVRMGRARLLGFLGTGGLRPEEIAADLRGIAADLGGQGTYGANFLASPLDPAAERAAAELLVALEVPHVEAAAFTTVTPDLAWLRARGLRAGPDGGIVRPRQIVANNCHKLIITSST